MKKSELRARGRLIYGLPSGKWEFNKSEFSTRFTVGKLSPGSFGWRCSRECKPFALSDLQQVCRWPLNGTGLLKCLEEFGWFVYPFKDWGDVLQEGEVLQGPTYASWWLEVLPIKRAYWLWRNLRDGKFLRWETILQGTASHYRMMWPKSLQMSPVNEGQSRFSLFFGEVVDVRREPIKKDDGFTFGAATGDDQVSRTMGKLLLAKYVNQGLKESGINPGFLYDTRTDTFRTDVAETEALHLKAACWLILRDLTANVSGLRFCKAPGCTNNISHLKKGANVCRNTCQKRLDNYKEEEAVSLLESGYSLEEILQDLNSREIGKITASQVKKWIKGAKRAKKT